MENRPQLLTEALLQPWDAPDAASPPKVPPCDGFPFASEIVSGSVDLEACAVQDATGFAFGKDADSWVAAIRVKRRLVSACLLLGFFFGMVCNLAGFGGESLCVLIAAKQGVNLNEGKKSVIFNLTFWTVFTLITLLIVRHTVLAMLAEVLVGIQIKEEDGSRLEKSDEERSATLVRRLTSDIDYLDDRLLLAMLFGSANVALATNLYLGRYEAFLCGWVGLLLVAIFDCCCFKSRVKEYYGGTKMN